MKARTPLGFSLLELMITIIVGAILAAFALPSFRTYLIRNNISSTSNGLLAAMNTGRAEAVKRNAYVRVDPTGCGAPVTTSWSNGAFVWLPASSNPADTVPTAIGDPRIISGVPVGDGSACNNGQKLTISTPSGNGDVVCYNGSGRANLNVVASACTTPVDAEMQIKICDQQNVVKSGAILDVWQSGRASIEPNVTCP